MSDSIVRVALVIYGIGLTIGNWLVRPLADALCTSRWCRARFITDAARAVRLHDAIADTVRHLAGAAQLALVPSLKRGS